MGTEDQAEDMERHRRTVEVALDQAIGYLHGIRREIRSQGALGPPVDPHEPAQPRAEDGARLDRRRWSSATRGVTGTDNDNSATAEESATVATKDSAKGAAQMVTPEMKKVAREAAIVVLTLAGKRAATGLTKKFATRGPEMYRQFIEPRVEEAGGINELARRVTDSKGLKGIAVGMAAESVLDKFTGGKGGGRKADDTCRGRRRPAGTVPVATSNSAELASSPAPPASAQSSGAAKRTAKKTAPTGKTASGATKKASAPPASVPPTPDKAASSARKTTSRRTSR
jgi:hypothetical protein